MNNNKVRVPFWEKLISPTLFKFNFTYILLDLHVDYGGQPTLAKYFEENPKGLPDHDAAIGCHVLLLQLFSVGIWKKLLTILDADGDGEVSTEELKALDIDGTYVLDFLIRQSLSTG